MTAAISGVGMHRFGRFPDKTVTQLGINAVRAALADAGDGPIDAAFCGTAYAGVAAGHKVLDAIGRTGVPIVDVEAGCASGAAALSLAVGAVESGRHDRVLAFGIEKMPKGMIRSSFFEPWREQAGLAATPATFALRAQLLLRDAGLTKADLAGVVVRNRARGVHNPDAMFRATTTVDEVLASRVVCEPLHLHMLCSPNEGAAAVVVERIGAIDVLAATLLSHLPGNVLSEATPLSGLVDDDIPAPTELVARDAYEAAGLGPDDLDVVECQDTDAARQLISIAELGLCDRADLARWVKGGERVPVNPSGGLLSKGEPLGASALGQVVELIRQLRGQAGDRQVPDAHVGLAHTVGRGANASVVILRRP